MWALGIGAVGLAASVILLFIQPNHFYHGYLVGFTFWVGASCGCMAVLMLHHLVAGEWGLVGQRILEAGSETIYLMAVFFVPILFGMHELYEWTHEEVVAESPALQHKKPYLNTPFFLIRTAVYFTALSTITFFLVRWSAKSDRTGEARFAARLRRLSAGGLVVYILLMTLASVDWVMSIEPHWFSKVYGWMLQVSQSLVAITLVIVLLTLLRNAPPLARIVKTKHFHDWGNLLLAFVILWAYLMFAQFLIMWSGNIPEDVAWYTHRTDGAWLYFGPAMIIAHFAVPFLLLLFRRVKRHRRALAILAGCLFVVHVGFVAWLVLPGFVESSALATFLAAAASWIGIGGCWLTFMLSRLSTRPLLPTFDPRFEVLLSERAAP